MASQEAVILFAHGARHPEWARPLRALAQRLAGELGGIPVHLAFLELQEPTLESVLDAAAAAGAQRISLVPVFWSRAGHVDQDLPPRLAQFADRHPGVAVRVMPVLSELPGMETFLATAIRGLHGAPS